MRAETVEQVGQPLAAMAGMNGSSRPFGMSAAGLRFERVREKSAWCKSQDELRQMSAMLLSIQERERQRIALDLHDVLGQSLTLIKLSLEDTSRLLAANETGEAAGMVQRLKLRVNDAFDEMRRIAKELRPSMLDDLGILSTLSWFFREVGETCPDLAIEKDFSVRESDIPAHLRIVIFRIAQEATGNIIKHAHADRIRVKIGKTGGVLHFSIEDNGRGFDQAAISCRSSLEKGLGLVSMQERAELSGGNCEIASAPGRGTQICISWIVA
jgi:signal transduction histidine kinase